MKNILLNHNTNLFYCLQSFPKATNPHKLWNLHKFSSIRSRRAAESNSCKIVAECLQKRLGDHCQKIINILWGKWPQMWSKDNFWSGLLLHCCSVTYWLLLLLLLLTCVVEVLTPIGGGVGQLLGCLGASSPCAPFAGNSKKTVPGTEGFAISHLLYRSPDVSHKMDDAVPVQRVSPLSFLLLP